MSWGKTNLMAIKVHLWKYFIKINLAPVGKTHVMHGFQLLKTSLNESLINNKKMLNIAFTFMMVMARTQTIVIVNHGKKNKNK